MTVKCTKCSRQFKDSAALKQHMSTKHALGAAKKQAVARMGTAPTAVPKTGSRNQLRNWLDGRPEWHGLTDAGKLFFFRNLTPADERLSGPCKIPDEWNGDSCATDLRVDFSFPVPDITDDGGLYDLIVLTPPVPDLACVYAVRKHGESWPSQAGHEKNQWNSVAFPAIPTGYVNTSVTPGTIPKQPQLGHYAEQYRGAYKSDTLTLVGSSLNVTGMVYTCQFSQIASRRAPAGEQFNTLPIVLDTVYDNIPVETHQIIAKSSGAVKKLAKEGAYETCSHSQPVYTFASGATSGGRVLVGFSGGEGYIVVPAAVNQPKPTEASTQGLFNPEVDMTWTVTLFTGINKNTNVNATFHLGLEAVPTPTGPWTGFASPSPALDRSALDAVRKVRSQMAQSYPAKYNSLGFLLPTILGVARTVLPGLIGSLSTWLQGKASNIGVPPNVG